MLSSTQAATRPVVMQEWSVAGGQQPVIYQKLEPRSAQQAREERLQKALHQKEAEALTRSQQRSAPDPASSVLPIQTHLVSATFFEDVGLTYLTWYDNGRPLAAWSNMNGDWLRGVVAVETPDSLQHFIILSSRASGVPIPVPSDRSFLNEETGRYLMASGNQWLDPDTVIAMDHLHRYYAENETALAAKAQNHGVVKPAPTRSSAPITVRYWHGDASSTNR